MAFSPDVLRSAFVSEDLDNDGLINLSELRRALLGIGEILTEDKLQELFAGTGKQNKIIFGRKFLDETKLFESYEFNRNYEQVGN